MRNTLRLFIVECLAEKNRGDALFESHCRSSLLKMLVEATARIFNLDQKDILQLLDDILSGQPVLSYTEKLAGTFFEVMIQDGRVQGRYKDTMVAGRGFGGSDESGVASIIQRTGVFDGQDAMFQFEVINPSKLSDYIDYALGDKTLAVEVTGKMTSEQARRLNDSQDSIRFMSQPDIVKRPKPLSPKLRAYVQEIRDRVASSPRLSVDEKKKIERVVSSSLVEIFGDSVLGGRIEGLFITGGGKPFKIPEKGFADIQRLQAPMYAVFSGRSGIYTSDVIDRLRQAAGDPAKASSDRMVTDIRNYLEAAAKGMGEAGFRTFFSPDEAQNLLAQFNSILAGEDDPRTFVRQMADRIGRKRSWVQV